MARAIDTVPTRADEFGVHSLDHFALTVPNLDVAQRFYSAAGLELKPDGNSLGIYTQGCAQRWGLLIEGTPKRLHHLSFGVFEEDFNRFKRHIEKLNLRIVDPPPAMRAQAEGLWIRDPDGTPIELRVAPKSSPDEKSHAELVSSPAGCAGAPKRSQAPRITPSRLAHCLIFTRGVAAAIAFYADVLGLRLSDRSGNDIAFMHGIHGSDHHLIAFARSNSPGLHHCCWDVRSLSEIGLGAMQMAARGFTQGWGLGRHVLGSNYFHYVRDPWGSYSEYSCDMDYIPAGERWPAADHDADDAFYIWGPNPPADWTHNYETDQR